MASLEASENLSLATLVAARDARAAKEGVKGEVRIQ